MPPSVELEQLRLIDDFLEGGDAPLADDAFEAELEQAVLAAAKSKLRRTYSILECEKDTAWVASLRNARLLFRKADAF